MSFFISNFKRPFLVSLVTAASLLVMLDMGVALSVRARTSAVRFIDNKESKFEHLRAQNFPRGLDAVFLGSSYTKNHISTTKLKTLGIETYNLGISGRLLGDFPSMAAAALETHAKLLVLTISPEELYLEPSTEFPHWSDIRAFWTLPGSPRAAFSETGLFLLGTHKLHYYREPIYEVLRARLVGAETPEIAGKTAPPPNYAAQLNIPIDCDEFKRNTYASMTVLTCTNGDGIQLGLREAPPEREHQTLDAEKMNPRALALLRHVIRLGEEKGAKVVVILLPDATKEFQTDIAAWQKKIPAPLLDLTDAVFLPGDWCDESHFNIFGRDKYSALLADRLKRFL